MDASRWTTAIIIIAMILLSGWISSSFGQLFGRTAESSIATNYQTMAIVALVVAVASAAKKVACLFACSPVAAGLL